MGEGVYVECRASWVREPSSSRRAKGLEAWMRTGCRGWMSVERMEQGNLEIKSEKEIGKNEGDTCGSWRESQIERTAD